MKTSKIIFGLMLTATLAGNAQTSQKKTKKAATAKKASSTTIAAAPATSTTAATSSSSNSSAASAVQTSSAPAVTVAPAESKKWGGIVVLDGETSTLADPKKNSTYETRIQNVAFETANYLGLNYKINSTQKFEAQQFFNYTKVAANDAENSQKGIEQGNTRLVYSFSGFKIAGSDEFTVPLRLISPSSDFSNDMDYRYGVNTPIEIGWTLSPKWTVSVLAYPSLRVFGQSKIGQNNAVAGPTGVTHLGMELGPNVYYNISDAVQPYAQAHMISYFAEMNRLTKIPDTEKVEFEAGMNFNLPAKITLTPAVQQSHNLTKGSAIAVADAEETKYRFTGVMAF